MKKLAMGLFAVTMLLGSSAPAMAAKVYVIKSASQAQKKVYVVKYATQANCRY